MIRLGDIFKRNASREIAEGESLRAKLRSFQGLLEENNAALAAMADLEEKRGGEYLFDRAYLTASIEALSGGIGRLVGHFEALTDGGWPGLREAHAAVDARVSEALRGPRIDPNGPMVLRLGEITPATAHQAGGKMGHLGRLAADLGLPVPDGFVVTAAAFARFLSEAGIIEQVRERLAGLRVEALADMERASAEIRGLIAQAPLPPEISAAIRAAVAALADGGAAPGLAVRSSAVWEDGEFSFAGQYATYLNVPPAEVERRYRDVVGSLFTPRAIFYYRTRGFAEEEMAMAVGVMRMVDARAAGVLYTRDPLDPAREVMVVNAAWGLGTTVVDGAAPADSLAVDRATGVVLERRTGEKGEREVPAPGGGVRREAVQEGERGVPSLDDARAAELARHGAALEAHFGGRPQDIEWALDNAGRLWVLQSRPLQLLAPPPAASPPRRVPGRRLLLETGVVACRGVGAGPVAIVRTEADAAAFPAGAVLVARTTAVSLAPALPRAAALVTDVGAAAGHLASLAREYRVPALLDTGRATAVLAPGAEVTVDAFNGNVYEGRVEELLRAAGAAREPLAEAPLLQVLARALEHVSPLHLTDPAAADFRPQACRTFHDVTRFAHEKAMDAMFDLGDGLGEGGAVAVALHAGIPVAIRLLDLGGGLAAAGRAVDPEAVRSVPFAAFLRGMRAMSWPEPRAADAKGLLGMMAHTAAIPEEQLRGTAEKSLALVGASYMNFSIRLGYHFSQVEAWVGERLGDNYVRFFFKGGGAARDRRLRRVRLIAEILARLDFQVRVVDDVVRALAAKYRRPELERTLEVLGRLTAYTKQLDMAMFNDAVTDWYRDEFLREHLPPAAAATPAGGAP